MVDWGRIGNLALTPVRGAREHSPLADHLTRTGLHYDRTQGSQNAAAITYYGFLSFFPLLALGFFAIGRVADVFPDARGAISDAIGQLFPGIVGDGSGQINLADVQRLAGRFGWLGLLGALYTGLQWLSALRTGLISVFQVAKPEQPDILTGKLRDLTTLPVLAVALTISVGLSSVVTSLSKQTLDWLGWGDSLRLLLLVATPVVGVLASTLLFAAMYVLLAHPQIPRSALLQGAVMAAVAFEVLKLAASYLLARTSGQAAFQLFGISLILIVWINYFSKIALYGAAWAQTSRTARAARAAAAAQATPPQGG